MLMSYIVSPTDHHDLITKEDLLDQFELTLTKLQSAEAQIEELKLSLDDALGAEEMLVQLTEKNLALADVKFLIMYI